MSNPPLAIKIGDLLIRSNIVNAEEFEDAVKLADRMRVPLGRVLQMHNYCLEEQLDQILEIQQLIVNRTLALENGVRAVEMIVKQGLDLDTALRKVNPVIAKRHEGEQKQHKLGELLQKTGLITKKQLSDSVTNSLNTNLPLGLLLVNAGSISMHVLACALRILALVGQNKITPNLATHALGLASLKHISVETALIELGKLDVNLNLNVDLEGDDDALANILFRSGVISESQLLTAKELVIIDEEPPEKMLVELGFCSQICVEPIYHLLEMLKQGMINEEQAYQAVRKLKSATTGAEAAAILTSVHTPDYVEPESVDMSEVLLQSGLASREEIESATPLALETRKSLVRTLVEAGVLDERSALLVTRIKEFLDEGFIVMEQAKIALAYSIENDILIDDALRIFGWTPYVMAANSL